tara:strand:+ start:119 stop:823 length:705 start_codon:yes stop_codon:yes gene_type:complete
MRKDFVNKNKLIYPVLIFIFSVLFILILYKIVSIKDNNQIIKKILSTDPIIFTIDNFLSNKECDEIIKLSKNRKFSRGYVLDSESENTVSDIRTNSLIWIDHGTNYLTKKIVNRISTIVNLPPENAEDIQLIRYKKNEQYRHHYDAFHIGSDLTSNQRLYTALVYLSDVDKGGETDFKELSLKIIPKKGKLIIFKNCLSDNRTPHPKSIHAGLPVLEGEKYAFNLWFHEKYYRK